jgi:hypothetical protein
MIFSYLKPLISNLQEERKREAKTKTRDLDIGLKRAFPKVQKCHHQNDRMHGRF